MKAEEFIAQRAQQTELGLQDAPLAIKRFFALDEGAYQDGELDKATKEMLGLVASLVLRCDDCIRYHLIKCHNEGITTAKLQELMNIALIVGGSIVIPHYRRAMAFWADLAGKGSLEI